MEDYEAKKFVAKSENTTVGQLLDLWVEEELKPGNLSNGTVMAYQGTVSRIKQHPIGSRKLKSVTPTTCKPTSIFSQLRRDKAGWDSGKGAQQGVLTAVFGSPAKGVPLRGVPKRLISFNPMQYVIWRGKKEEYGLFDQGDGDAWLCPLSPMSSSGRWRTF